MTLHYRYCGATVKVAVATYVSATRPGVGLFGTYTLKWTVLVAPVTRIRITVYYLKR
jgi:hypothetical protein